MKVSQTTCLCVKLFLCLYDGYDGDLDGAGYDVTDDRVRGDDADGVGADLTALGPVGSLGTDCQCRMSGQSDSYMDFGSRCPKERFESSRDLTSSEGMECDTSSSHICHILECRLFRLEAEARCCSSQYPGTREN